MLCHSSNTASQTLHACVNKKRSIIWFEGQESLFQHHDFIFKLILGRRVFELVHFPSDAGVTSMLPPDAMETLSEFLAAPTRPEAAVQLFKGGLPATRIGLNGFSCVQ